MQTFTEALEAFRRSHQRWPTLAELFVVESVEQFHDEHQRWPTFKELFLRAGPIETLGYLRRILKRLESDGVVLREGRAGSRIVRLLNERRVNQ